MFEYEMKKYGLTERELVKRYVNLGVDKDRILASHARQVESFQAVAGSLAIQSVFSGEVLKRNLIRSASLVLILGGDNYFQYVSHFIDNQPVLGINSDPESSEGALTYFSSRGFIRFLPDLLAGYYQLDDWTRLHASINGKNVSPDSVSEIYIGARQSVDMSRYILDNQGVKEEHKNSGLIIATGTGSSGWYDSVYRYAHQGSNGVFSKTSPFARFIVREPFSGRLTQNITSGGSLEKDATLSVSWLAHGDGIVSTDSKINHSLKRGSRIDIKISDKPLRVVKMKNSFSNIW